MNYKKYPRDLQVIAAQAYWQHTDVSDGQESPNLNQLTQLTAKTGFKININLERFKNIQAENRGIIKNGQLQIKYIDSYKKEYIKNM